MSRPFRLVLIWLFCATLAFCISLAMLKSLITEVGWVPPHQDAFYHAKRILDFAAHPSQFYQFDPYIHAPEGSMLTWPWAFDSLFGALVYGLQKVLPHTPPMEILAFMPPLWTYVNSALFLSIALRLGLSTTACLGVLLCYAATPRILALHLAGDVDHHFMEFTFTLATLSAGLGLFASPSRRKALILGAVLGFAPAFQTGLFILQMPVLLTVVWLWLEGTSGKRFLPELGVSCGITTLLGLLPSLPFRQGSFDFTLHSSFHLYVSFAFACLLTFMARRSYNRANLTTLAALGLALLLPLSQILLTGASFILSRMPGLEGTLEMMPAWEIAGAYTALFFLFPIFLWMYGRRVCQQREPMHQFCLVFMLWGAFLLLRQIRFAYYGIPALIFPFMYTLDHLFRTPLLRRALWASLAVFFAIIFMPTFQQFRDLVYVDPKTPGARRTPVVGAEIAYEYNLLSFQRMRQVCQQDPGIILADPTFGHYIRFHSDCSVLANRMLISPLHFTKAARVSELMKGSVEAFWAAPEPIDYVFVSLRGTWHNFPQLQGKAGPARAQEISPILGNLKPELSDKPVPEHLQNMRLITEQPTYDKALFTVLLYDEAADWGEQFELLHEQSIILPSGTPLRWSRFFRVKRAAKPQAAVVGGEVPS